MTSSTQLAAAVAAAHVRECPLMSQEPRRVPMLIDRPVLLGRRGTAPKSAAGGVAALLLSREHVRLRGSPACRE